MNESEGTQRLEAKVFGRVQMVMFRDFVCRSGRSLGLAGTAKNLPDGSVEVISEGEREKLEELLKRIHKGSFLSHVKEVRTEWEEPSHGLSGFHIIYD